MAAKTTELMKRLYDGSNQSLTRKIEVKPKVRAKVWRGVMLGRTPNVVDPMRPREDEVSASVEMGHPRATRSANGWNQRRAATGGAPRRALHEYPVYRADDRPDVAGPVRMIQPSLEREEAREDLAELGETACNDEGAERDGADGGDDETELDHAVDLELCRAQARSAEVWQGKRCETYCRREDSSAFAEERQSRARRDR